MMPKTLLAIDQGTTSSRAILFSATGEVITLRQKELRLYYPKRGWVEQDPQDIWMDTLCACRGVIDESPISQIAAVGITNQRETTIIWDRETGEPVYNAIVWQDRRTADLCARLREQGYEEMIAEKTGLLLDPYFSATKIAWILEHVEDVRARAEKGKLAFGTVDTFLLWRLTAGRIHATDAANASRTMLFNIRTQEWDKEILKLFNIPEALLPEVKDNVADFGETTLFTKSLPIGGLAGDQHAALIGQACFEEGMVKSTYGTGCFMLMNTGSDLKHSHNRLLTSIGYRIDGQVTYILEGSIFIAGAAIQWLREGLGLFSKAIESEALASSVKNNNGVYFVPAFTGLGAPYWQPQARGLITGLGRESTAAHITRAALEAQGYQTLDLMIAMIDDSGTEPAFIRADGGLVANNFVCQFLADMLDKPIEIPHVTECTAWGAAALAGMQTGVFSKLENIADQWHAARRYEPQMDAAERKKLYQGWKNAIDMILP